MSETTLTYDQLVVLIRQDLEGNATPLQRAWLEEHVLSWRDVLGSFMDDLNNQLAARKPHEATPPEELAEYREWHRRALGFKRVLTRKMTEADIVKRLSNEKRERSLVRELIDAVDQHRRDLDADDVEPSAADERLWKAVDDLAEEIGFRGAHMAGRHR